MVPQAWARQMLQKAISQMHGDCGCQEFPYIVLSSSFASLLVMMLAFLAVKTLCQIIRNQTSRYCALRASGSPQTHRRY